MHMYVCMYALNTGIVIIKCQGHKYSMEKRYTTVINLDAHLDHAALHRARNDPKVAAVLHSLGVKREEQYKQQGNKKLNKLVSYTITATDAEKPKYLIKKLAEMLPEFFDDDNKELINSIIDERLTEAGQQKRQTNECRNKKADTTPDPEEPVDVETCIEIYIETTSGDAVLIKIIQDCEYENIYA